MGGGGSATGGPWGGEPRPDQPSGPPLLTATRGGDAPVLDPEGARADLRALIDRRRLRRRVTLWRLVAIVALVVAAAAIGWRVAPTGEHVARFTISGVIFDDADRDRTLRRIAEDDAVRALVLRIDSPGGSVAGSEALYQAIRDVAARKPVVAVMGEVAASGGYIASIAADHILARGATLTGSIGVVAEFPNVEELLDAIGVGVARVASDPLKAEPSPFRAPTPEALASQGRLIADAYDWFVGLVADRRGMTAAEARAVGDGRVFSGRLALDAGLIDAIGGEEQARDWLAEAHAVPRDLPAREVEIDRPGVSPFDLGDAATGLRAAAQAWIGRPHLMAILR